MSYTETAVNVNGQVSTFPTHKALKAFLITLPTGQNVKVTAASGQDITKTVIARGWLKA